MQPFKLEVKKVRNVHFFKELNSSLGCLEARMQIVDLGPVNVKLQ